MRKSLIGIMLAGGFVLSGAHDAWAQTTYGTFALKAVSRLRSGVTTTFPTPLSNIPDAQVGDEYTVEIRLFDFEAMTPFGGVRQFQGQITGRASAESGGNPAGLILPKGWNAPLDTQVCNSNADCPSGTQCDVRGGNFPRICIFDTSHNPFLGAMINAGDPDWIFVGLDTNFLVGNVATLDYIYAGTATGSVIDPTGNPNEFYGGTLILVVKPFACGPFTFNLQSLSNVGGLATFFGDSDGGVYRPIVVPLTITVGTCPPVKQAANPPNCSIDSGRPHPLASATPKEGLSSVVLTYNQSTAGLTTANFAVTESPEDVPQNRPTLNLVSSGTQLTVNFRTPPIQGNQPLVIDENKWTCVRHIQTNLMNCWGNLPGDINEDRVVNDADFTFEDPNFNNPNVEHHPGLFQALKATSVLAQDVRKCDVDRSTRCTPLDILTEVDLQAGHGAFEEFRGQSILTACPSR